MESTQKKTSQVVTAIGNSWVICRSKSHPGRIYYFNTLTGEAAWNLSESEMEKAKKNSRLEIQTEVNMDSCPEPKDPPTDHCDDTTSKNQHHVQNYLSPENLCNKLPIDNPFPKQPYSFATLPPPNCNHLVPSYSSLNAANPLALGISNQNYNPNVWTVPSTHQIFIAPAMSSLINQSQIGVSSPKMSRPNSHTQTSVNWTYNNMDDKGFDVSVQKTSLSLSRRFQDLHKQVSKPFQTKSEYTSRGNNRYGNRRGRFQRFRKYCGDDDLRNVLIRQHQSQTNETAETSEHNCLDQYSKNEHLSYKIQCDHKQQNNKTHFSYTDAESNWLEDHVNCHGTKLYLNVTRLKNLSRTAVGIWYIAADNDILLNHFILLNILLNSDDDCRLVVTPSAFAQLRLLGESNSKNPREANRARRAVRFLRQQLNTGIGEMATDSLDILNSCIYLSEKKFHVILLSNDDGLHKYKNIIDVSMFTINQLKDFLSCEYEPKTPVSPSYSPESAFKLNNLNKTSEDMDTLVKIYKKKGETTANNELVTQTNINEETIINSNGPSIETYNEQHCDKAVNTQTCETTSSKPSVDAEVQTDFPCPQVENTVLKRRDIRLNRTISNQASTTAENTVEKKQFKWRKRRITSNTNSKESSNAPELPSTNESQQNVIQDPPNNNSVYNNKPGPTAVAQSSKNTIENDLQLTDLTQRQSIESIKQNGNDNLEGSETSSSVFIQRNISGDKMIIEETSTSGIISNSTSNGDSENESIKHSKSLVDISNENEVEDRCNHVMFLVNGLIMEEYLKMRCDEWVSRFIQIMEEVLTQILQQPPQFVHPLMPPPWSLHEASECIRVKFSKHKIVVNAAARLSNMLFKISGGQGRISSEINPSDYMEMYSYGVHLVDSLQMILKRCDDVQIASESLSKLLHDIQNPSMDAIHNDTFINDSMPESENVIHNTSFYSEDVQENVIKELNKVNETPKTDVPSSDKSSASYNLRSRKKNMPQEDKTEIPQVVKFIRNIDVESTFFSSLNLRKNLVMNERNEIQNDKKDNRSQVVSERKQTSPVSSPKSVSNLPPNNIFTVNNKEVDSIIGNPDQNKNSKEPKFIRKFSAFPEFEEKLKNNYQTAREPLNMDDLDYSAAQDGDYDYMENDYYTEEEYYDKEDEIDESENPEIDNNEECRVESPKVDINGNSNMSWVFKVLINEVKEAFIQVHAFCEEAHKELTNNGQSNNRKEIHKKAEQAYSCIDRINKSLNSIYYRENIESGENFQSLLQNAGFNAIYVKSNQFMAYRDIIAKCMDQANILQESVNVIISAVQS